MKKVGSLQRGLNKLQQFDKQHPEQRIFLNGRAVSYITLPSRRRRRGGYGFTLSVGFFGVRVRVPPRYSLLELENFLKKHSAWLFRQVSKYEERAKRIPKRSLEHGEVFPLGGKLLPIVHVASERVRPRVELHEEEHAIRIYARPMTPFLSLRKVFEKWLRRHAHSLFKECVERRAKEMGVKLETWAVRNQKTRWGTCSRKGHLFFNWRLALAPPEVLDYVVVHELGHLVHANHGAQFWKLVERFCPQYQTQRHWLKENGDSLVL